MLRVSSPALAPSPEIERSNLPTPAEICRSDFGIVARALWPDKTAATLAHLAGGGERAARDWLAGRVEAPGCIIALIVARCTHRRRD